MTVGVRVGLFSFFSSLGSLCPMSELPGCLDDAREAMLLAALPLRRAVFRRLLRGRTVSVDEVAGVLGQTVAVVEQTSQGIVSVGMAELSNDRFIGMDGLTTRRTEHTITLDGVALSTWCAYDIVGIASALGKDATGRTRCGACGRALEVEILNGEPPESPIVGWLPSEACANVKAEFCSSALFFCSMEHLEQWLATSDDRGGEALSLPELAERGRDEWRQVVA